MKELQDRNSKNNERSRGKGSQLLNSKGVEKGNEFKVYVGQNQSFRLPYIIPTSPLRDMPVVVPSYKLERIRGDGVLVRK